MAHPKMLALCLTAFLLASAPAASAARLLRQIGQHQWQEGEPQPHLVIPRHTLGGTDILMTNNMMQRGGDVNSGVVSNEIQGSAAAGSTYDYQRALANSKLVERADKDLLSAIGSQDHASYVQNAVSTADAYDHTHQTTHHGANMATIMAYSSTNRIADAANRAALSSMDTSHAIQAAAGGATSTRYATRSGAASTQATMSPETYFYVSVPTWWRRR